MREVVGSIPTTRTIRIFLTDISVSEIYSGIEIAAFYIRGALKTDVIPIYQCFNTFMRFKKMAEKIQNGNNFVSNFLFHRQNKEPKVKIR